MSNNMSTSTEINLSVPEQLKTDSFRFIKLKKNGKEAIEPEWQKTRNYDCNEIEDYIRAGRNYGVICVSGDVAVFDADNVSSLCDIIDFDNLFSNTFTVKSGSNNKRHIYFKCIGLGDKKIVISHPVTGEQLGDIRPCGSKTYVVGPSSIHPSGERYEVIDDSPIREIDITELDEKLFSKVKSKRNTTQKIDALLDRIPKNKLKSSSLLCEKIGLRIEDIGYPVGETRKFDDEIQGSHPIHGSTNGMNYSINTKNNVWHCFRHDTGGDPLTFIAVKHGLISCEEAGIIKIEGKLFNAVKNILSEEYGFKEKLEPSKYSGAKEVKSSDIENIQPNGYILEPRLPQDHFVMQYANTICEMTDSYRDYQYGSALMLLSMVIQRKAYFNPTYGRVYPNLWLFYLGSSSYSKKTTAVKFAREMANNIIPEGSLSNNITPERLVQDIAEHPCSWQFLDEASSVLSDMKKKSYMSSYKELLCSLYDEEPYQMARSKRSRGRPKKGEREQESQNDWQIRNGYINCLFATTPDSFGQNVDKNDLKSGMLFRFAFIYPRYEKELMPTSERTKEQEIALKQTEARLAQISKYFSSNPNGNTKMNFSPEAQKYHQKWELKNSKLNHKRGGEDVQSAQSRLNVIMQKIAMLLEIGSTGFHKYMFMHNYIQEPDHEYEISLETTKESCRLIDEYFAPVIAQIYDRVCMGVTQTVQDKIIKVIEDHNGVIPLRDLRVRVRVNRPSEFDDAIMYMSSVDDTGTAEIEVLNVLNEKTKKYTKMVVFRGKNEAAS